MAEAPRGPLDKAGIAPAMDESGVRRPIPAVLDTGSFSEEAVAAMEREGFDPSIATGRQRHHTVPTAATAEAGSRPATSAEKTAKEKMRAKLDTKSGRALSARRKTIVEPVFGQIKEVRGFRRFLLRGLSKLGGEWRLVCLTHNLKIWRYGSGIHSSSRYALIN
jgi:IS5 family transposase